MAEFSVQQLKQAARRAYDAGNIPSTKRLIAKARSVEAQQKKAETPDTIAGDIAKAGAAGVIRGAAETADLTPSIIDAPTKLGVTALRALGFGSDADAAAAKQALVTPEQRTLRGMADRMTGGFSEYQGSSLPAEYAGTIGEFAGGAAALPIGGVAKSVGSTVVPAIASETAGQIARAKAPELESQARMLAALGVPLAQTAATPLARRLAIGDPSQVSGYSKGSPRPSQVEVLERAGVKDLTAGQKIGSEQLMRLEDALEPTIRQKDELTMAASRQAGIDGLLTEDNLTSARSRITKVFDDFDDLVDRPATMAEADEVAYLLDQTSRSRANYKAPPAVREVIEELQDSAFSDRPISGDEVRRMRKGLRKVYEKNIGDDNATAELASELQDVLQQMATRQVAEKAPDLLPKLQEANKQYRSLLTLEKAVSRAGSEAAAGRVTPAALASSTRGREGVAMTRGTGSELAELAKAAQGVMTPLPTVGAGGVRFSDGNLVSGIVNALPRTIARTSQDTLARPAGEVMTERLLRRLARQSGGLLNIE